MIVNRLVHLYGGGFVSRTSPGADTTALLGDVLAQCRSDGQLDARLDAILHQWAIEARNAGVTPERMVIALKELWFERAEHDPTRGYDGTEHTLIGVLSTALTAYFADKTLKIGRDSEALGSGRRSG
jgi:hypothetical protein